jgi:multimeric flavodoxin WrbA
MMKAIILLGTLKKTGLSHTETLCEFLAQRLRMGGVECDTVKLLNHRILPGAYTDMGNGDEWPGIFDKVRGSDMILIATPIWWGGHSSLVQGVIERLDEVHDHMLAGHVSALDGKVAGIVITGDSDGAQHVIGNLCNFFNALGVTVPPYATLSVLWERQSKGSDVSRAELMQKFEQDYTATADKMIAQLVAAVRDSAARRAAEKT